MNAITKAMKENLGLAKSEDIKTFAYDYATDFERTSEVIGKGIYTGSKVSFMPNFVGDSVSNAKYFANMNDLSLSIEYMSDPSEPTGIILKQSVSAGTMVGNISGFTIYVNNPSSKTDDDDNENYDNKPANKKDDEDDEKVDNYDNKKDEDTTTKPNNSSSNNQTESNNNSNNNDNSSLEKPQDQTDTSTDNKTTEQDNETPNNNSNDKTEENKEEVSVPGNPVSEVVEDEGTVE